jgi:hypothetical protein
VPVIGLHIKLAERLDGQIDAINAGGARDPDLPDRRDVESFPDPTRAAVGVDVKNVRTTRQ